VATSALKVAIGKISDYETVGDSSRLAFTSAQLPRTLVIDQRTFAVKPCAVSVGNSIASKINLSRLG
jgi:hypothetical protein